MSFLKRVSLVAALVTATAGTAAAHPDGGELDIGVFGPFRQAGY